MRRPLAVLVLLVTVGGLTVTNPGMEAFQSFVRARAADRIERGLGTGVLGTGVLGTGVLGEALGGAGGELLASNASTFTDRRSYLVCSVYAVDLDRDGDVEGRVLGIARRFIVVDDPEGDR